MEHYDLKEETKMICDYVLKRERIEPLHLASLVKTVLDIAFIKGKQAQIKEQMKNNSKEISKLNRRK